MNKTNFETGIKQGAKILANWANGVGGINANDAANQLRSAGYGNGYIDQAFDIAVNAEGYEYLIEAGLREMLAEFAVA